MVNKTTIAIPAYNEERFIAHTLESALFQADEIIISDNASTDETSEICKYYAQKYDHIKYHRNENTITVMQNFYQCVSMTDNPYFMFLGAHDLLSHNYITTLRNILDSSEHILAYSNPVHLTSEYSFLMTYDYFFAKDLEKKDVGYRVQSIIKNIADGTMFHGLYKKKFLEQAISFLRQYKILGTDHELLTFLASLGTFKLSQNVTYFRISPRVKEENIYISWKRYLKAIYGKDYNEEKHPYLLVPVNIALIQFDVAKKLFMENHISQSHLQNIFHTIFYRYENDSAITQHILKHLEYDIKKYNLRTKKTVYEKLMRIAYNIMKKLYSRTKIIINGTKELIKKQF